MTDRLDCVLVEKGIASGRDKAKEMIASGHILVDGKQVTKPSKQVDLSCDIVFTGEMPAFVSRGGLKLAGAVEQFGIELSGRICVDIGASTGGFTDCMLKCGASRVYAVDVGCGQLHQSLMEDNRVINMEKTNIRYIGNFPEMADFVAADVSFISLSHVFPSAAGLMKPGGEAVFLIKPQFEAGRGNVGKGGIVKDKAVHSRVITTTLARAEECGFKIRGLGVSPIKGSDGNVEYLMYAKYNEGESLEFDVKAITGR